MNVRTLETIAIYPQRVSERRSHDAEELRELGYVTCEPIADGSGDGRYVITAAGREYLRTTQGNPLL